MSDAASPFVTLRAGAVDRGDARLRTAAAIVCALGAGLFALSRPGALSITLSVAVLAAGLVWARRARATAERTASDASLSLTAAGLERAGAAAVSIPWADVTRIEVDDDRLVVVVGRRGGDDVVIEPVYDGVSLRGLADAIVRARDAAR